MSAPVLQRHLTNGAMLLLSEDHKQIAQALADAEADGMQHAWMICEDQSNRISARLVELGVPPSGAKNSATQAADACAAAIRAAMEKRDGPACSNCGKPDVHEVFIGDESVWVCADCYAVRGQER